ncbi:hypothetical protein LTR56_011660 [Elasticomyces elasticus]|nr:hypothetical protein LTR56_011660 [Elasticomyces elasticus]KAK3658553.1 hypothetical protein LTR22_008906 [Elasticomyces elasticus]KAK4921202.1 hypothetical protein LTR49_011389 [Elasticomyces elasticus]KAK5761919.1 hypothetical protein LTS12_007982 [Elasticomyces elasticus]
MYVDRLLSDESPNVPTQSDDSRYGVGDKVPSSTLAFFSDDAIDSLCQRLGHNKVRTLVNTLEVSLKVRWQAAEAAYGRELTEDLDLSNAHLSRYIQSYFEQVHPIYPFLDQVAFERRASSEEHGVAESSDKVWSALYYAVISLGCMFHDGGSFKPAHGRAWHYFRVAFQRLQDVLVSKASLLKAQAITAMAIFALNYSSLQIETLCISEAARTIITLRLHKTQLEYTSSEESRRVFWVVYCIEKEYAFNSSHGSLISDSDISCPLPSSTGFCWDFDWLRCWGRYSRILSRAYEALFSTSATMCSKEEHFANLDRIEDDLQSWKDSVPIELRPGSPLKTHRMSFPHMQELALRIHFAYYNLQICMSRVSLHICPQEASSRRSDSKMCLLLAARSIIESTPFIAMEPFTPVWILGCMPMVAMFIIFDFVIYNPVHAETRKNLAYLDIVSAHFARLDLASQGTLHDAMVAEFTSVARRYVDKMTAARDSHPKDAAINFETNETFEAPSNGGTAQQPPLTSALPVSNGGSGPHEGELNYDMTGQEFAGLGPYDFLDFPEESSSLYMALPQSGYGIADIFSHPFIG